MKSILYASCHCGMKNCKRIGKIIRHGDSPLTVYLKCLKKINIRLSYDVSWSCLEIYKKKTLILFSLNKFGLVSGNGACAEHPLVTVCVNRKGEYADEMNKTIKSFVSFLASPLND